MLVNLYPKEGQAFYNLGVCYTQTGRYEEALELCSKAIIVAGEDKELIYDSYKLKGIC